MSDHSDNSVDTFASETSFEVEDFSPPDSPVGQDYGREPYQFEPLQQPVGAEVARLFPGYLSTDWLL
ncbi:hypothetical protein ABVT39_021970 [Epinephelus coioides]